MGSIPGLGMLEPYCEAETWRAVAWAINDAPGPVYLRLVSVPCELGFTPPDGELVEGRGTVLRRGTTGYFVCTGPVLVAQAWLACELVGDFGLIALPWLRDVDGEWLAEAVENASVVCVDNHVRSGGQGEAVLHALATAAPGLLRRTMLVAVEGVPACGTNDEVLRAHGLDAAGLAAAARDVSALVT
jgi:transketolase